MSAGPRRRGVILLDEDELSRAVRLPDEWRLIGFRPEPLRLAIALHIEGDGLPECSPGDSPPVINPDRLYLGSPRNVAALSSADQHTAVLAALYRFSLEHQAVTDGRARILTRHAPDPDRAGERCLHPTAREMWPCADYLDAAAGLVTGLPGMDTSDDTAGSPA